MPVPDARPAPPQLTGETIPQGVVDLLIASLPSPNTRRGYKAGIECLRTFAGRRKLSLKLLLDWRADLAKRMTSGSVNAQVVAAKRLCRELLASGAISSEAYVELDRFRGLPQRGHRAGTWLDRDQVKALLGVPDRKTLKGKRNYCILCLLIGCGLRRHELTSLRIDSVQMREARWVLADIRGKGNRVRTVAVPAWVKQAIDSWTKAAGITSGLIVRQVSGDPAGLSEDAVWEVVRNAGAKISVEGLGPHDLRRTCAKLCRANNGRLEQIQMLLGHASIQTTERYLGSSQNLKHAVNDTQGIF